MSRTPPISLRKASKTQKFDISGISNYYYFNQLKHYLNTSQNITNLSKTLICPILEPKKGQMLSKIDEPVFQFNLLPLQLLFKMSHVNTSQFENARSFFNTKTISNGCASLLLSTRLNYVKHLKNSNHELYVTHDFKLCNPFYLIQSLITDSNNKIFTKPLKLESKTLLQEHYTSKKSLTLSSLSLAATFASLALSSKAKVASELKEAKGDTKNKGPAKSLTYEPLNHYKVLKNVNIKPLENSIKLQTQPYNDHLMSFLCGIIPSYLLNTHIPRKHYSIFSPEIPYKSQFDTYFYGISYPNIMMLAVAQQLINGCNVNKTQGTFNNKSLHVKNLKVSLLTRNYSKQNIINHDQSFLVNDPISYTNFLSDLAHKQKTNVNINALDIGDHQKHVNPMVKLKSKDYLNMSQTKITPTILTMFSARFNSPQYLHNFYLITSRLPRSRYNKIKLNPSLNNVKLRSKKNNTGIDPKNNYYNVFANNVKIMQSLVTFELWDTVNAGYISESAQASRVDLENRVTHDINTTKPYFKMLSIRL